MDEKEFNVLVWEKVWEFVAKLAEVSPQQLSQQSKNHLASRGFLQFSEVPELMNQQENSVSLEEQQSD